MKTRPFDIKNHKTNDITRKLVQEEFKEYINKFETKYATLKKSPYSKYSIYNYLSIDCDYENLSKADKKYIEKIAKEQYEEKKAKTEKEYTELRKLCDDVFYDDNQYKKLTPELEHLYYCQAIQMLEDFKNKKQKSKAISNSKYQARLMSYSKISCD